MFASVVTSGIDLPVHAEVENALAQSRTRIAEWGFKRLEALFDASECAYATSRGRLAEARATFEACVDPDYAASTILARTGPTLALALADDRFVERTIDRECIDRERATLRAEPALQYSRLLLAGYAVWVDARGRADDADALIAEAFGEGIQPAPRFASALTLALRHFGARRVPNLELFASQEQLHPSDAVGRATAKLARGALERCRGEEPSARFAARAAADAYADLGFPLYAAHAYHFAGEPALAQLHYLACGAVGYARVTAAPTTPVAVRRALSEQEERVAELAGIGLRNFEIATRLSVSTKTVEKHLASTFRKLELRSRHQIATRLKELRSR